METEEEKIAQRSKIGHPKRLVDQLTEAALASGRVGERPAKKNKAIFLSKKDEIKEALDAGWLLKNIWTLLVEQQAFIGSYDCFLHYVRRYIKNSDTNPADIPAPVEPPAAATKRTQPASAAGSPDSFDFSPTYKPQEIYGEDEKEKKR